MSMVAARAARRRGFRILQFLALEHSQPRNSQHRSFFGVLVWALWRRVGLEVDHGEKEADEEA